MFSFRNAIGRRMSNQSAMATARAPDSAQKHSPTAAIQTKTEHWKAASAPKTRNDHRSKADLRQPLSGISCIAQMSCSFGTRFPNEARCAAYALLGRVRVSLL
jgi:hypothetical protein